MLLATVLVLCLASVGAPFIGGLVAAIRPSDRYAISAARPLDLVSDALLLLKSLGVAAVVALGSTALGLPAAWALRRLPPVWSALLLAPMLLPNYLVYAAWGNLRGPGTWLGDWLSRQPAAGWRSAADTIQAVGGLALWAWPISALILAVRARPIDPDVIESLRLTGAGSLKRALVLVGLMRGALIGSVAVVGLLMLGSAVPLHVAQIECYALVIWRELSETGGGARGARDVWIAACPLVALAVVSGWMLGSRVVGMRSRTVTAHDGRLESGRSIWFAGAFGVWFVSVALPMMLFSFALENRVSLLRFWSTTGPSLAGSLRTAAFVAACAALITVGTAAGFSRCRDGRSDIASRFTGLALRLWLIGALVPGVLIGAGVLSISQVEQCSWLGESSAGLVLCHLARYGALAALCGWWIAYVEPGVFADARRLYQGASLRGWLFSTGGMNIGAVMASSGAVGLLSLHEIEATVLVAPPAPITEGGTLAQHMLSLLHYMRDEELNSAALWLMCGGLAAATGLLLLWSRCAARLRGTSAIVMLVTAAGIFIGGCDRPPASASAASPLRQVQVIGTAGLARGEFVFPRAIDCDGSTLFVIDKTARVQRMATDGRWLSGWTMPRFEEGKPCGITCGPDGLVYVADTHEHRVSVFSPDGELVKAWGEYGLGPGQFIYPTDVALVPDSTNTRAVMAFVSEYGGNDRISAYDLISDPPKFLFSFGREGAPDARHDVCFRRPQSLVFDPVARVLMVADAVNHRLGVFTEDGVLLRWIGRRNNSGLVDGSPGSGAGEFAYPYGLALLRDGTVLVSEYGNNRVQRIDPGRPVGSESVGCYGESGRGEGQLAIPWGVAASEETVFVLDSGNNRIQSFRIEVPSRRSSPPVNVTALPSAGAGSAPR